MKNYTTLLSIIAVIISFAGGFLLANALNKSEMEKIKAENNRLMNAPEANVVEAGDNDLSNDEINQKIAQADQNAGNFEYQKNLGIALYRYSSMKKNTSILLGAEKILLRANQLDGKDLDVINALGNLNFDLGYQSKDNQKLENARIYYKKILDKNPEDVDVRTDLAITYYLESPPNNDAAIAELNKSLKIKPDNQKTLQFLIQTYLRAGKKQEAEAALTKLKTIDPNTPTLNEIATQLEQNESKTAQ